MAGLQETAPTAAAVDGTATPGDIAGAAGSDVVVGERLEPRKALVRKVAQLTKVVVHLNARNDEAESRYERLRLGFEEELRTIAEDAVLKLAAEKSKFQTLVDPTSLTQDVSRAAEAWVPKQAAKHEELDSARRAAALRHEQHVESTRSQLQVGTCELRAITQEIHETMEMFRTVVGRSRAELEQKDAALQEQRSEELRLVAAEHKRRLEDLRTAQARDLEQLHAAAEQARRHVQRMHDSELSTLRMHALQRRRERIHRLEQGFGEECRTLEQQTQHMGFEVEQQRQEMKDTLASRVTIQQQVDVMRSALDELTQRVEQSEADVAQACTEAAEKEAVVAQLQSEVAVLQVRQRAAGMNDAGVAPPAAGVPGATAAAAVPEHAAAEAPERRAANELSNDLREAILSSKQMGAEVEELDAALAGVDEDLTEREKEVEVLEVEIEEEQLRTHQLQARVLKWEALMDR